MKYFLKIFILLNSFSVFAQLPETEIFLAQIEITNNLIKFEKVENISNHTGYDNQPYFLPNGKIILFSSESEINHAVHIRQYEIKSKEIIPFTLANNSDYSPELSPDQKNISSVVVEEDSTQRVWLYGVKNSETKSCLTPNTDSIGYYAWLGSDTILYYKLTNPHSLRILNLKSGEDNWLCDHPTRSFKKINSTTFFYVIHEEKQNLIYFFDIRTKKASLFATDIPENQDYVWQAGLGMIKSELNKLYRYSPETKVWSLTADFTAYGITKITRFAFSQNKKYLAVVSNPEKK